MIHSEYKAWILHIVVVSSFCFVGYKVTIKSRYYHSLYCNFSLRSYCIVVWSLDHDRFHEINHRFTVALVLHDCAISKIVPFIRPEDVPFGNSHSLQFGVISQTYITCDENVESVEVETVEIFSISNSSRSEFTNCVVFVQIPWFASPGKSSREFVYIFFKVSVCSHVTH